MLAKSSKNVGIKSVILIFIFDNESRVIPNIPIHDYEIFSIIPSLSIIIYELFLNIVKGRIYPTTYNPSIEFCTFRIARRTGKI